MDPQPQPARAPGASVELAPAAHGVAVNDEDLLSRDAQQAMQRIADPLAFLLVLFFIVGAASRPQQLRRQQYVFFCCCCTSLHSLVLLFGGFVALAAVVAVSRLYLVGLLARHSFGVQAIQMAVRVELKAEGLAMASRDGQGLLRWETVLKWREDEEFVLIYLAPRLFHILPEVHRFTRL